MANYSNLKTAIENAVDWNNGDNEITGQNLLDILETIIDSLGAKYKFADVATPSSSITTPDEPLFYLAGAGTYTNFSGLSVTIPRGTLAIFYYDTAWHYTTVRTDSDAFFNVNQYLGTPSTTYTKANARNEVPSDLRSKGIIITYLTTTGWLIEQNLDATAGTWANDASWQTIGPVSVSQNTLSIGGVEKGKVPTDIKDNLNSTDETSALSAKQGNVLFADLLPKIAINGTALPFDSIIYDKYARSNGTLSSLSNGRTGVYNVSGIKWLLLRWDASPNNVNYGVLFASDASFTTISSFVAPFTVTDGETIIPVPDGATYVAISNGKLSELSGRQFNVAVDNIYSLIKGFSETFNSYKPLTYAGRKYGYLNNQGTFTQTSSTAFAMSLFSVQRGQKFYFKQNIASSYGLYAFVDDLNASHVISFDATHYNEFLELEVPAGANYFLINCGTATNVEIPLSVSCIGYPITDFSKLAEKAIKVFNYNPSFSGYESRVINGSKPVGDIKEGTAFESVGAKFFRRLIMSAQQGIMTIPTASYRQIFKTNGKLRVSFDAISSTSNTYTIKMYRWSGAQHIDKDVSFAANTLKHVDLVFDLSSLDVANSTSIELYVSANSYSSQNFDYANLIITDELFEGNNITPEYSYDWGYINRNLPNIYKKCIYIGDSISTANTYNWKGYLQDTYKLYYQQDTSRLNPANGGIPVIPTMADESSLPNNQKSIWYRCAEQRMAGFTFDIISLFGGQNNKGATLGTISDKPFVDDASSFDTPTNYTDVWTDSLTFAQCYMGCIEMLLRDFPAKELVLCTVYPTQSDGNGQDMAILQCKIGHKYGLKVVPFYWGIFTHDAVDAFTIDGVHPNKVLARQMAIKFADVLEF